MAGGTADGTFDGESDGLSVGVSGRASGCKSDSELADTQGFPVVVRPLGCEVIGVKTASILEAAEAGGLRLPSSCRNGTCRACMCRLVEGQVRYRIEWPGLSADEKAEGWILSCVAVPASRLVIDQPAATIALPPSTPRRAGRGF
jgi:ferredoxin